MYLITAPTVEPLDLAEAKLYLRVTEAGEDTLITSLIVAARQYAEAFTGRALITQTWQKKYDVFPGYFLVPKPPLASVVSIKYLDTDGIEQTLATDQYRVATPTDAAGVITPEYAITWPGVYGVCEAVTLEFSAGYGVAVDVPDDIKSAMYLHISHFYDNRSGGPLPMAIDNLLYPKRVFL